MQWCMAPRESVSAECTMWTKMKCSKTHRSVKQLLLGPKSQDQAHACSDPVASRMVCFFMKLTTNNLELVSQGHGHRDTVLLRACESKIGFMSRGCSSVVKYVLSMRKGLDLIPEAGIKPESLLPPPQNPVDFLPGYGC